MLENFILGIDIGGSHITVAVVNIAIGEIVPSTKSRMELNSKGSLEAITATWTKAIKRTCDIFSQPLNFMGVSMPGPFDYNKGISLINGQDKYDSLYKVNIRELIATNTNFKTENIGFINDAAAFLQGEILGGAAKGGKNIIGLTLGTGLGSAKSIANESVADADLWKMPFKQSIAEEYISTRWFVKRFLEKTNVEIKNVKELHALAKAGDSDALKIFEEFGNNLGEFLIKFITQEEKDIDTIVLGGNISKTGNLFMEALNDSLLNFSKIQIKQAKLGEEAALIGAAGIWKNIITKKVM